MTKYRWQASVLVLVSFMLGCNEFMVVGVISDIAQSLHVTITMAGYLVTIFAIVYAISTPIITLFANRFNRFRTLMVLMVIFLIGNTASGFATSYGWFLVSRLITAAVAGTIESLITIFAYDLAPRHKRASLISWIAAGFSIASVIGLPYRDCHQYRDELAYDLSFDFSAQFVDLFSTCLDIASQSC